MESVYGKRMIEWSLKPIICSDCEGVMFYLTKDVLFGRTLSTLSVLCYDKYGNLYHPEPGDIIECCNCINHPEWRSDQYSWQGFYTEALEQTFYEISTNNF